MICGNRVLFDADAMRGETVRALAATIRAPRTTDGAAIWSLIRSQPSLGDNLLYRNLLQASHFGGTCALAELNGEIVGWVSAYIPPGLPAGEDAECTITQRARPAAQGGFADHRRARPVRRHHRRLHRGPIEDWATKAQPKLHAVA
jgi:hypothetical protein